MNKKRNYNILSKTIFFICMLIMVQKSNAQSLPMYSQYMYNMVNINPAYAGNRGVTNLSAIWREQWSGLPGSPTTKSFTYDMASNNKKVGFSVQLFEDKYVNYIKRTGAAFSYNIKIPVSDKGVLSMGLKAGFYNDVKNFTNANLGTTGNSNDVVVTSNLNKVVPLAGAGIYYNDDKFYIGLSAPDVITFNKVKSYAADNALYQVKEVHYFVTTGYSFDVNDDVQIKPSILLKAASGAPLAFDFNTNVWMHNLLGLGMSYRTGESVLGMAEIQLTPQLRFGYAYDMPFTRPNSHEFFMRYELGRLFPNSKSNKLY